MARQRKAARRPSAAPTRYQKRRLVIRFNDGVDIDRERAALAERYGRAKLQPVFAVAGPAIRRLQARAKEGNPGYPPSDLLNYHFLHLRRGLSPAEIAREISKRRTVASVYEDAPTRPANYGPSAQKCSLGSRHIDGQGVGVNAHAAWALPGGKGDGQCLVDVEGGWSRDHVRLPTSRIAPLAGESLLGAIFHGTCVLGVVCAQHVTGGGCEGVAPNVADIGLASVNPSPGLQQTSGAAENIYDAIGVAIDYLVQRHDSSPDNGHGVLLIERQTEERLPVETYPLAHEILKLATQLDVTVIEPAGNGKMDLDTRPEAQILRQDSGAIMVGAARKDLIVTPAPGHHQRFHWSNFGSRVDCYAWGQNVMAPAWLSGPGGTEILDHCNDKFGHTSAAAAIIAGAALIVQGLAAYRRRPPLGAAQVRMLLTNPRTATPCAAGDRIGVMPDLGKVAPGI